MSTVDRYLYSLIDPLFYETFDRYHADEGHYTNLIRQLIPSDWYCQRHDIWVNHYPPLAPKISDGWKIHISASLAEARDILASAIPVLARYQVPFKHSADGNILRMQSSKRWPRGKSCKFITAYPYNDEQFKVLIEDLYEQLVGYEGPYILSDKRYRDCQVLYYRYGGITLQTSLTSSGEHIPVIAGPHGQAHYDIREPFASFPAWVSDPFGNDNHNEDNNPLLRNGRYEIIEAFAFSTSGGVYRAIDHDTGREVVVKEARPFTNLQRNGRDAVSLLKKEHRLLELLKDTGIAPQPIEFFREWEHAFLVEELLSGKVLRYRASEISIAIRVAPKYEDVATFFRGYISIYTNVAKALAILHDHNIVFADVSHYNVIVQEHTDRVHLIDFEGAYQVGVDSPTFLYTPGFARAKGSSSIDSTRLDDCYGLGGLLLAGLMPINAVSSVLPHPERVFVPEIVADFGLPEQLGHLIVNLLSDEDDDRYTADEVANLLQRCPPPEQSSCPGSERIVASAIDRRLLDRIVIGIKSTADYSRLDRLFPADAKMFDTNPLQLEHGACGVGMALQAAEGAVPVELRAWIRNGVATVATVEQLAPGLYCGLAGIAWSLLAFGDRESSVALAKRALEHPLAFDRPGLFYGAAGLGLMALHFAEQTQDQYFFDKAEYLGLSLIRAAKNDDGALYWETGGKIYYGMGEGASGVSVFLLYLYMITQNDEILSAGRSALAYELKNSVRTNDGISWLIRSGHPTHSPYFQYGSCGVGMAVLRYSYFCDDHSYDDVLEQIVHEADRKYAIFPGRFFGLSGIGEFCMDLYYFLGEPRYLHMANKIASGVLLFAVEHNQGVLFPGEDLFRLSADLGTGAAGVLLFLNRVYQGRVPQALFLDNLLIRQESNRHTSSRHNTYHR